MAITQTQFEDQINGVFAEIYDHDGATPQTIATGASYVKVTPFTADGESNNCAADYANNQITITKTGTYKAECSLSYTGTGTNINWFGAVFLDGVEQNQIHFESRLGVAGDYTATQFGGYLDITSVPVNIDLRVRHDDGTSKDITVKYANLNAHMIGL